MSNSETLNSDNDIYTLPDNAIIEIIQDYIKEDRYKSAILIDGEWGSGKTFFVKEKLIKEIETKERKIIYITLYGMENIKQIFEKIYEEILINKILTLTPKNKKNDNGIKKYITLTKNILIKSIELLGGISKKIIGLDLSKIKDTIKIEDFVDIENYIIIFDDIERANIDINKIFGYINELVEHSQIKAILVANEKEIKNKKFYNKVKEKLIEKTIKYKSNLNFTYEDIIKIYIKENKDLKKYLRNKEVKNLVLVKFDENKFTNLRTLIYSLKEYEKFFTILQDISFDSEYIDKHKKQILNYILYLTTELKSKNNIDIFPEGIEIGEINSSNNFQKKIVGYKFISLYFSIGGYLNKEEIKKILLNKMQEEKEHDKKIEENNRKNEEILKLSFYSLEKDWWNLDDDKIYKKLDLIKEELEKNKYHPISYKGIIIMLLQLKNNKFKIEEKDFINLMERNLESGKSEELYGEVYKKEYFDIIIEDNKFRENYNNSIKNLLNIINEKKKKISSKRFFLEEDKWDSQLIETSSKLDNSFLMAKKFLFYANIEKIIGRLKNVQSPKEIYYLIDAIRQVYSFSNLNDYYKSDIDNIELFIKEIENGKKKIANEIKTREIALTALQKNLEDYLEKIKK